MTDIVFVKLDSEVTSEELTTNDPSKESSGNSSSVQPENLNNKEAYTNTDFVPADGCFHSIFGTETPDWTKPLIKREKDEETGNTETDLDYNKDIVNGDIVIKEEENEKKASSSGQCPPTLPTNSKVFLSQKAYEQYLGYLNQKIKCPNCFFTTINRGNLKQHMKKHEKPDGYVHKCELCNFKTKYKNSMRGHMARHDNDKTTKRLRK